MPSAEAPSHRLPCENNIINYYYYGINCGIYIHMERKNRTILSIKKKKKKIKTINLCDAFFTNTNLPLKLLYIFSFRF